MKKKLILLTALCLSLLTSNVSYAAISDNISGVVNLCSVYNSETNYEQGDYTIFNDVMYQCLSNTSGDFDENCWIVITVMDSVQNMEDVIGSADEIETSYTVTPDKETSVLGFLGNLWYQTQNLFSGVNTTLGSTAATKANSSNYDSSSVTAKLNYLEDRIEAVFQSASKGKQLLASTLTGLGTSTSDTASFAAISSNIKTVADNQYNKGMEDGTKTVISENFEILDYIEYEVGKSYPVDLLFHQSGMYQRYAYFQVPTVTYKLKSGAAYGFDHAKNAFTAEKYYRGTDIGTYANLIYFPCTFYGEFWDATTNTRVLSCNKTEPVTISTTDGTASSLVQYLEPHVTEEYSINSNNELIIKRTSVTYTWDGTTNVRDGDVYYGQYIKTVVTEEGARLTGEIYITNGGQYSFPTHYSVMTPLAVGEYTLYNTTYDQPYNQEWVPGYQITNTNATHDFVFKPTQYARYDILKLNIPIE